MPSAVSMPLIPFAASPNSTSLSTSVCGAWSVAMASAVPSSERREAGGRVVGRPERRVDAQRRRVRRRDERAVAPTGRRCASHAQRRAPAIHSSVSARWCGVTSQVTGRPAAFAAPDEVERAGGRDVRQVQPRARARRGRRRRGSRGRGRRPPPRPRPASRAGRARSRRARRSPRRRRSATRPRGGRRSAARARPRRPARSAGSAPTGPATRRRRSRRRRRRPARRAPPASPRRVRP